MVDVERTGSGRRRLILMIWLAVALFAAVDVAAFLWLSNRPATPVPVEPVTSAEVAEPAPPPPAEKPTPQEEDEFAEPKTPEEFFEKATDAVHWGFHWLYRHQHTDGSWSMDHTRRAEGRTSGGGQLKSDMAATALGVLPFLAAGYTHKEPVALQEPLLKALQWMIENQHSNGLLLGPKDQEKYITHGLAAMTLCEAYALTKDEMLAPHARQAVTFLVESQNPDGTWGTKEEGITDTVHLGFAVMSLLSAKYSGLENVDPALEKCQKYFHAIQLDETSGKFGSKIVMNKVEPGEGRCESAIGNLFSLHMGMPADHPRIQAAGDYFLANPVSMDARDSLYFFHANQVVHNIQGPKWDAWNRVMKRTLTEQQNTTKGDTDHGSWDPLKPTADKWAKQGGRHWVTSFHILCLEIYYRYLPLYLQPGQMLREKAKAAKSD